MKIARVIIKQSALQKLRESFPELLSDPRIIIELMPDAAFNRSIALDQIEESYGETETRD